jgi:hypothetical protein
MRSGVHWVEIEVTGSGMVGVARPGVPCGRIGWHSGDMWAVNNNGTLYHGAECRQAFPWVATTPAMETLKSCSGDNRQAIKAVEAEATQAGVRCAAPAFQTTAGEPDTVGLLLDFGTGSLTVFRNGVRQGVVAVGLEGELCWAASLHTLHCEARIVSPAAGTPPRLSKEERHHEREELKAQLEAAAERRAQIEAWTREERLNATPLAWYDDY